MKKQLDGLEIMACMSSLLLANCAGADSCTTGDAVTAGQWLSNEETQQLCRVYICCRFLSQII